MNQELSEAIQRAINEVNFFSVGQISSSFFKQNEFDDVTIDPNNEWPSKEAANKALKFWAAKIGKHYGGEFTLSAKVKGLFAKHTYFV